MLSQLRYPPPIYYAQHSNHTFELGGESSAIMSPAQFGSSYRAKSAGPQLSFRGTPCIGVETLSCTSWFRFLVPDLPISIQAPPHTSNREIRVVHLLPRKLSVSGDPDGSNDGGEIPRVSCPINYISLNEEPAYVALSYIWGDPFIKQLILLNNQIFQITKNLAVALEHLQHGWHKTICWIDAICIN